MSHTLRGCVDWNLMVCNTPSKNASHTLRGCVDWNNDGSYVLTGEVKSHPAWVCGLKHCSTIKATAVIIVTPCVGVWIETHQDRLMSGMRSHTLRGCVDWNIYVYTTVLVAMDSHTLRGCVDWNFSADGLGGTITRHTLRGCVDWN